MLCPRALSLAPLLILMTDEGLFNAIAIPEEDLRPFTKETVLDRRVADQIFFLGGGRG